MAPTPKPPGQRQRRSTQQHEWKYLPAGESGIEPPPLPTKNAKRGPWTVQARSAWLEWWASPMARVWLEADKVALRRALALVDDIAAGRSNDHAALTALEDRLGLTPKARRLLMWEIERATTAAPARRTPPPGNDPRLRVVS